MPQTKARPQKIKPSLPNPALPEADWADCYRLRVAVDELTAIDAARLALGHFPPWVRALITIRNTVVAPFGLKPAVRRASDAVEMIGLFPVIEASVRRAVLGFDDKHLDFRVVIDVADAAQGKDVSVTTLVHRKILFGKIYIAAITPFHNLIVATTLADMGKRLGSLNRQPSA
jgi:hypothetical protein